MCQKEVYPSSEPLVVYTGEVIIYGKSRKKRPYKYPPNLFLFNNMSWGYLIPQRPKPKYRVIHFERVGSSSYTPPKPKKNNHKKKPCPGDPIKNPEIAPQTNSGVRGGMFGYTRSGGKQFHNGIDIKNDYGDPIYSMYAGTARLVTQTSKGKVVGAGHYVEVTSTIDNKKVQILYFHMQKANRVSGSVKAGSIIGYQGYSGNLKAAITQGLSQSHVHIKLKVNGKTVDPMPYMATQFDNKTGKAINNPCK